MAPGNNQMSSATIPKGDETANNTKPNVMLHGRYTQPIGGIIVEGF
jgi:hypothetical protein